MGISKKVILTTAVQQALTGKSLRTLLVAGTLSMSSAAFAVDTDGDDVDDLFDAAPNDIELSEITINRVVNGDFESDSNEWNFSNTKNIITTLTTTDSYNSSTYVNMVLVKEGKNIQTKSSTEEGGLYATGSFTKFTLGFRAKVNVLNEQPAAALLAGEPAGIRAKIVALRADGSNGTFPIYYITDTEWTTHSVTYDINDVNAEVTAEWNEKSVNGTAPDPDYPHRNKVLEEVLYNPETLAFKVVIQGQAIGDDVSIDDVVAYTDIDKQSMLVPPNGDEDGLIDISDPHPTQAYFAELEDNLAKDFDGDGVANFEVNDKGILINHDALPYNPDEHIDSNNNGWGDGQETLSHILVDRIEIGQFGDFSVNNDVAKIGDSSTTINTGDGSSYSNAFVGTITENIYMGFWAKIPSGTDTSAFTVKDGKSNMLELKLKAGDENAPISSIGIPADALTSTNIVNEWTYFEVEKTLTPENIALLDQTKLKFQIVNQASGGHIDIDVDGFVIYNNTKDELADVIASFVTDSDDDGIEDYSDKDDDNDGLLDGEDVNVTNDFGDFSAPDIDQDGYADTDDLNDNGILDFFEVPEQTEIPLVILNGAKNIVLFQNATYEELGAVVTDDIDTGLTATITYTLNEESVPGIDSSTIGDVFTITYSATDSDNHTGTATRTVTIIATPPNEMTITGLNDIKVEATSNLTTVELVPTVEHSEVSATTVSIANDAPAGFPVGTTIVTWTIEDSEGNVEEVTQSVTVKDTTAPKFMADTQLNFEIVDGNSTYTPAALVASDLVDGNITATTDFDGSNLVAGTYSIEWSAEDSAGNSSKFTQTLLVTVDGESEPDSRGGSLYFGLFMLLCGSISRRLFSKK
ncbi:immunoglobulin-like domain-containing protein [Thalassotalea crassostreae]|uniref:immunoglobulin-like domain-containing protein n=1 Tax=Thalassotalea crassostreae TaxID=1763536 RepID=UPI000838D64D|nr:immunoglobulin-like domain-containing protein [Thalassotalea crassostreae]